MKQAYLSVLRHLLTVAGGSAVTHGYATSAAAEQIVGAVVALVGLLWGSVDEYLAEKRARENPAIQPDPKPARD